MKTLDEIYAATSRIGDIKSYDRHMEVATARHLFCYKAFKEGYGYSAIGRYIGRDSSTVIHSVRMAAELIEVGDKFIMEIVKLWD